MAALPLITASAKRRKLAPNQARATPGDQTVDAAQAQAQTHSHHASCRSALAVLVPNTANSVELRLVQISEFRKPSTSTTTMSKEPQIVVHLQEQQDLNELRPRVQEALHTLLQLEP